MLPAAIICMAQSQHLKGAGSSWCLVWLELVAICSSLVAASNKTSALVCRAHCGVDTCLHMCLSCWPCASVDILLARAQSSVQLGMSGCPIGNVGASCKVTPLCHCVLCRLDAVRNIVESWNHVMGLVGAWCVLCWQEPHESTAVYCQVTNLNTSAISVQVIAQCVFPPFRTPFQTAVEKRTQHEQCYSLLGACSMKYPSKESLFDLDHRGSRTVHQHRPVRGSPYSTSMQQ
jgi:hypothetical protein